MVPEQPKLIFLIEHGEAFLMITIWKISMKFWFLWKISTECPALSGRWMDVHEEMDWFAWAICREAGQERGPHREGAAQRQEEAARLWRRGEHHLPRHANNLSIMHALHTQLWAFVMSSWPKKIPNYSLHISYICACLVCLFLASVL